MPAPIVVVNAVGLTKRLLPYAPRLAAVAQAGWSVPFREVLPAVTCTSQATLLTGKMPNVHGIVANGWLYRETNEVRFWQQSNRLIQAEPVYAIAKAIAERRGRSLRVAKLFWWFNQGAAVDWSVTPKPHYAIDGRKAFDIATTPADLGPQLIKQLGTFPFPAFWGPRAGIASTQWIAAAAAIVLREHRPDLLLVYLPHLDYEPQRFGPSGCDMAKIIGELDLACSPLLDAAKTIGARVWIVSEYGHCNVSNAVLPNVALRKAGLLEVRDGPFGEQLDLYFSRAFAVCDHQLAHIYVNAAAEIPRVCELLNQLVGIDRIYRGEERADISLDHPRSGEIIAIAKPDAWFAYPFWLDEQRAPDYARCVAIHHKPGFDPCELFFDPGIRWPAMRVARKLAQKSLGFRMSMDVVPLAPQLVRGSHGLAAADDADRPIWIGDGPKLEAKVAATTSFRDALLNALDLPVTP